MGLLWLFGDWWLVTVLSGGGGWWQGVVVVGSWGELGGNGGLGMVVNGGDSVERVKIENG